MGRLSIYLEETFTKQPLYASHSATNKTKKKTEASPWP